MAEEKVDGKEETNMNEHDPEVLEELGIEEIPEPKDSGNVLLREIEDEMKQSYLDYSMSVIVGRALPDVRDGLKPVHRRILYAMHDMGMHFNKAFKKSARIVGEVLGKYHPHGDSAVYDSLVRMAQEFSLRYPLIKGQGNFGSVDGDSAAAMRYTEAKLAKISSEMLQDIEKDTVEFIPNFDNTLKEPSVLPAKLPNLLVNGTSGIAVGMATNIPPHNMNEICDAAISLIDNPEITINELMSIVKGPDFPTGATVIGKKGIEYAYRTGRGRAVMRAKTHVEDIGKRKAIIVTEIPYQVNKSAMLENMAALVRDKKIDGIHNIKDESDREGMRVVIELKSGANEDIVLNQLYKHTRLQDSFGIIMIALVDNVPKVLNLKQILEEFVSHRQSIVRKRTEFDLKKAKERAHVLEGLIIALDDIDNIIEKIKKSKDTSKAQAVLIEDYGMSEVQAKAVLEMKLSRLAALEQDKIRKEHEELMVLIKKLNEILADESKILAIIKEELEELKEKYGDARKTEIIECAENDYDIDIEDLIEEEEMIVTISHKGYIKRLPKDTYRQQKRGGKGVKAAGTADNDFVESIFVASTHDYIMFFTNKGKVHWLKVYKIPEASRTARGTAVVNLIELEKEEKVEAFVTVKDFSKGNIMFATKKGVVKKTPLKLFSRPRRGGIIAITLDPEDELIGARITTGDDQVVIATNNGYAVKFHEKDVRPTGRSSRGVRGIRLRGNGQVIGMVEGDDSKTLLTITEKGFGKRSKISDYRLISRGGAGVINIKCSSRNGYVAAVKAVDENDDIMFISRKGIAIRVPASGISIIGRNTQGVRLMKLHDDSVVAAAKIISEEKEDEEIEKRSGNDTDKGHESPVSDRLSKDGLADPEIEQDSSDIDPEDELYDDQSETVMSDHSSEAEDDESEAIIEADIPDTVETDAVPENNGETEKDIIYNL